MYNSYIFCKCKNCIGEKYLCIPLNYENLVQFSKYK